MIDTNTCLASILEFTIARLHRCKIQISRVIDDHGAFTTELKDAGNQVLCSCSGYELTLFCASSETNDVEFRGCKFDAYVSSSLNNSKTSLVEVFVYKDFEDF